MQRADVNKMENQPCPAAAAAAAEEEEGSERRKRKIQFLSPCKVRAAVVTSELDRLRNLSEAAFSYRQQSASTLASLRTKGRLGFPSLAS